MRGIGRKADDNTKGCTHKQNVILYVSMPPTHPRRPSVLEVNSLFERWVVSDLDFTHMLFYVVYSFNEGLMRSSVSGTEDYLLRTVTSQPLDPIVIARAVRASTTR